MHACASYSSDPLEIAKHVDDTCFSKFFSASEKKRVDLISQQHNSLFFLCLNNMQYVLSSTPINVMQYSGAACSISAYGRCKLVTKYKFVAKYRVLVTSRWYIIVFLRKGSWTSSLSPIVACSSLSSSFHFRFTILHFILMHSSVKILLLCLPYFMR